MRYTVVVLRLLMVVGILAGAGVTLASSEAFWADSGFADLVTLHVNFFSYFTIESNLAAAVVLAIGAGLLVTGRAEDPRWFTTLRMCVVVYMAVTGIVYNLLLRGLTVTGGDDAPDWTNEVLHVVAPAYLVLDWLFAPGRTPLPWNRIGVALVYPLAWTAYTLLRAPLVHDQVRRRDEWYPYPFLDPATAGWGSVAFYVVVVALLFAGLAALAILVSRRFSGRATPREERRDDTAVASSRQ